MGSQCLGVGRGPGDDGDTPRAEPDAERFQMRARLDAGTDQQQVAGGFRCQQPRRQQRNRSRAMRRHRRAVEQQTAHTGRRVHHHHLAMNGGQPARGIVRVHSDHLGDGDLGIGRRHHQQAARPGHRHHQPRRRLGTARARLAQHLRDGIGQGGIRQARRRGGRVKGLQHGSSVGKERLRRLTPGRPAWRGAAARAGSAGRRRSAVGRRRSSTRSPVRGR